MEKLNVRNNEAPVTAGAALQPHRGGVGGARPQLAVYAAAIRAEQRWISCALVCPRLNAWVYLEQEDLPEVASGLDRSWQEELRKVPHVLYARGDKRMAEMVRHELALMLDEAGIPDGEVVVRASPEPALADLVGAASVGVAVRPGILRMFHKKCGVASGQPRAHALLQALALAVADANAVEPMVVHEINRLELLLGTKNSQSMRAWLRERASGSRPRSDASRSSARRLALLGARETLSQGV